MLEYKNFILIKISKVKLSLLHFKSFEYKKFRKLNFK